MQYTPTTLFFRIVALIILSTQSSVGEDAVPANFQEEGNIHEHKATALDSCKLRCGQTFTMPCSCDVTCLVYRNCCEDMESECPHVLIESRQNFPNQLTAQLDCTYNGYLFISSCPDIPTDVITSNESKDDSLNVNSKTDSITFLYKTVLVTDLKTGLTLKNLNIFNCNAANGSMPMMWKSYMNYVHFSPKGVLQTHLDNNHFLLFTLPHKTFTSHARCIQDSNNTCIRDSFDNYTELTRKCNELKSYVKIIEKVFFNKIYCALCNEVNDSLLLSIVTIVYIKQNFNFAIVGTVNQSPLTLEALSSAVRRSSVAWYTISCSHSKEPLASDISCAILVCAEGYRKRPDGQCKKIYSLRIAFPKEDFLLSKRELEEFPDFLLCFLRSYNFDVLKQRKLMDVYFDIRLKKTFYETQMWLYDTGSVISLVNDNLTVKYFVYLQKAIAMFKRNKISSLKLHIPKVKTSDVDGPLPLIKTKDLLIKHMALEKYFVISYDGTGNASLFPICVDHYIDDIEAFSTSEVPHITTEMPDATTEVTPETMAVHHRLFHCVYSVDLTNEVGENLQYHPKTNVCNYTSNGSEHDVNMIYSALLSSIVMLLIQNHYYN